MIKDDFWRSNVTAGLSTEDRYTLVYLQTCPSSNVIGVFQIVPSISAAEMGWDPDQLLTVIRRLTQMNLVDFDPPTNFVWVRTWWQHNVINGAFAGKVRGKALAEIRAMPERWIEPYVVDLIGRSSPDASVLQSELTSEFLAEDAPSMGHPSPINGAAGTTTTVLASVNPTTTTDSLLWDALPTFSADDQVVVVGMLQRLEADQHQVVLDELAGAIRNKTIKGQWPGWLHGVVNRALEGNFKPNHAIGIQAEREQRKRSTPEANRERMGYPPRGKVASPEVAAAVMASIMQDLSLVDPG